MFFITKKFGGGCPGHNPELCVGTYFHVCLILKLFVKYPTIWIIWCFFIRIRLCGFDRNDTKEKPPVRHITGHLLNSPSVIINVKSDHLVICWKISNFPFVINRYFVGGDTKTRLISSYFWAFGVGPLFLPAPSHSPFLVASLFSLLLHLLSPVRILWKECFLMPLNKACVLFSLGQKFPVTTLKKKISERIYIFLALDSLSIKWRGWNRFYLRPFWILKPYMAHEFEF